MCPGHETTPAGVGCTEKFMKLVMASVHCVLTGLSQVIVGKCLVSNVWEEGFLADFIVL